MSSQPTPCRSVAVISISVRLMLLIIIFLGHKLFNFININFEVHSYHHFCLLCSLITTFSINACMLALMLVEHFWALLMPFLIRKFLQYIYAFLYSHTQHSSLKIIHVIPRLLEIIRAMKSKSRQKLIIDQTATSVCAYLPRFFAVMFHRRCWR